MKAMPRMLPSSGIADSRSRACAPVDRIAALLGRSLLLSPCLRQDNGRPLRVRSESSGAVMLLLGVTDSECTARSPDLIIESLLPGYD
jgi:hypothetical protein